MVARVLILGGTSEARALAALLVALPGVEPVSSLAGRVAEPAVPEGDVRIGGFGGAAGLKRWLAAESISAVVDATHPFAATISRSAAKATSALGLPLLVVRRPGWTERDSDNWHRVPSLTAAAQALTELGSGRFRAERVFLTTGRKELAPFAALARHWFLIRSIDLPDEPLPARHEVLLARGPFTVDGERALLRHHRIDVLVTKDSGGALTEAKLTAARDLSLPVIVVDRPPVPDVPMVATAAAAAEWIVSLQPG